MMKLTVEREFAEVPCAMCAIVFYVPQGFDDARRRDGLYFFCPNGHRLSFGETEADKLRRERDRLKQDAARLEEEARLAWNTATVELARAKRAEAEVRRVTKRATAAVCPCCNRSFSQLARHMKTKHPDVVALPGRRSV